MFSWLFGKKEAGTKTIAILDIGSGSVAGALGTLNREGAPELLFSVREDLPVKMTRDGAELAEGIIEATKHVADQVKKAAILWSENNRITPKKIEHLAIFLAAPWSLGTIHTVRFAREKPFKMTADVLRRMLLDETKGALANQRGDFEVLERVATHLKLNGYPVDVLTEAPIHQAEVTLATSLAPKEFIARIVEALGEIPHGTTRSFHSFSLAISHILPRVFTTAKDAVLIDAGAEVTEVLRLRDGAAYGRATAPVGTHLFFRTMRAHAKMDTKEAQTAMKLAKKEGTRISETHSKTIATAARDWAKGTLAAIASISEESSSPMSAYIFADTPAQTWCADALMTEPYPRGSTPIPQVQALNYHDFENFVRVRGVVPDVFLCAELLFADYRFDEHHAMTLLSDREPLLGRVKSMENNGTIETSDQKPVPASPSAAPLHA